MVVNTPRVKFQKYRATHVENFFLIHNYKYFLSFKYTKQVTNLSLLNHFYLMNIVATNYCTRVWSLVMVRKWLKESDDSALDLS